MRIRNRQKSFPLLPVTHPDPNLISRSPVMVQLSSAATPKPSCILGPATAPSPLLDRPQPSDPPIGNPTNGSDASTGEQRGRQHKKQESLLVEDGRREEDGRGQKGNDTRKASFSCSKTSTETFPSSNPPKEDGGWCEGEKAFPLKKRRGRMEHALEDNNNINGNDDNDNKSSKMKMKTRMKAKMNKKCSRRDKEEEEENKDEVKRETKTESNVGKKRARGGALMEGSRCSRVNGRGWRCCQQTLVGYSLCEHHLGKGRLRSMTSVRNKSIGTTTTTGATKNNNNMAQSESSSEKQRIIKGNDAGKNDEKKPLVGTRKRMKLGMVKARSISSLLGQTNTEIVAVAEDNDNK
ncbi:hypothetical protein Fmac_020337 [Flemingia macrophylla]|uniref:WRC domain-containing protein n=1 Tax=Flemingia macrophylla TaxID=520843 RepID=A0ABD1LTQ6_9FABA